MLRNCGIFCDQPGFGGTAVPCQHPAMDRFTIRLTRRFGDRQLEELATIVLIEPQAEGVRLEVVAPDGSDRRIVPLEIVVTLVDPETGEVVDDVATWLRERWLAAQARAHSRYRSPTSSTPSRSAASAAEQRAA